MPRRFKNERGLFYARGAESGEKFQRREYFTSERNFFVKKAKKVEKSRFGVLQNLLYMVKLHRKGKPKGILW